MYGINRAYLPADVAFDAFFRVYGMYFIRRHFNGIRRTPLSTFCAAVAIFLNDIGNQAAAFTRRTFSIDMRFVFLPEIFEGRQDRIWR